MRGLEWGQSESRRKVLAQLKLVFTIIMVEGNEDKSGLQVLLVHGWLDNSNSFIGTAPLVGFSCNLVALMTIMARMLTMMTIMLMQKAFKENIADGKIGVSCCCP